MHHPAGPKGSDEYHAYMKRRMDSLKLYTCVTPFLHATQTACHTSEVEMKCMYIFRSKSLREWKRTLRTLVESFLILYFNSRRKVLGVKFTVGIGFRVEVVT